MSGRSVLWIGLIAVVIACGVLWMLGRSERSSQQWAEPSNGGPERPPEIAVAPLASAVDAVAPEPRASVELSPDVRPERAPAPARLWHGRVVDAETLAPVAGATLGTVESAADGRFPALPVSGTVLRVQHPDYSVVLVQVGSGYGSLADELVIPLARAATLEVVVRDESGSPCSDRSVRVSVYADDLVFPNRRGEFLTNVPDVEWTAAVDPAGRCEISGLAPGLPLDVSLRGCDQAVRAWRESVELQPGERRTLEWTLGTLCRLTGTALDENAAPVPDLEVALFTILSSFSEVERVTTDTHGKFEFQPVPPSTWWVMLAEWKPTGLRFELPPRRTLAAEALEFEVKSGEGGKDVTLRVHAGLFIHGTVIGPTAEPVDGCALTAWHTEKAHSVEGESGAGGVFELGPLVPGEYRIQAEPRGADDRFATDSEAVSAYAGDEGIVIELPGGGVIHGRTVDRSSGSPVAAWVAVYRDPRPEAQDWGTAMQSKKDGRFSFGQRAAGRYHAFAWTEKGAVAAQSGIVVGPGSTTDPVELLLEPGARVTFRLPRSPQCLGLLRVWSGERLIENDWFESEQPKELWVPSGSLSVQVLGYSGETPELVQELSFTVAAQETRTIELDSIPEEQD